MDEDTPIGHLLAPATGRKKPAPYFWNQPISKLTRQSFVTGGLPPRENRPCGRCSHGLGRPSKPSNPMNCAEGCVHRGHGHYTGGMRTVIFSQRPLAERHANFWIVQL